MKHQSAPSKSTPFAQKFSNFLGSQRFFQLIIGLLVVQAAWIALSGRYPMAFDEDFHIGIIRLYAHHISPFWSGQPDGADAFGAVARDPSYLFHYLLSFPYRIISAITSNVMAQVLVLRAINIGFFVSGLVLWRKLLLKTGSSRAIVHATLLVFILLPVVPLLAAQINYDNLIMPMLAAILLLVIRLDNQLYANKQFPSLLLGIIIGLCMLASLVKYAFLPIFLGILIFIFVRCWQTFQSFTALKKGLVQGIVRMPIRARWLVLVLLTLSSLLFVQRYAVNIVKYHTPVPKCDKVLNTAQCSSYGPWFRDYNLNKNKAETNLSPIGYIDDWVYGIWYRVFFAVDGPTTGFQTRGPLLVPGMSSIIFAGLGSLALLIAAKRLWQTYDRPAMGLFGIVLVVYVAVLWLQQYQLFRYAGTAVAVNGRYLVPVLLPVLLAVALSFDIVLRRQQRHKLALFGIACLSLLWGGGALTYILRSNDQWYWPNHSLAGLNHIIQRDIGPITPGYYKPSLFSR